MSRFAIFRLYVPAFLGILLLAGCAPGSAGGDAAAAVERYFVAIVQQDANQLSAVTCGPFEETALLEMNAFVGVEAELEGMVCSVVDTDEAGALVECQGKIVASYAGEIREFPLADRTFSVIQESGLWLVCGMN